MFTKGQVVTLRSDWRDIETLISHFTEQLAHLPVDTEFTVEDHMVINGSNWLSLSWSKPNGGTSRNSYEVGHFVLAEQQTVEELIEENDSLNEQIGRLEAQAEALQEKIGRKYEFVRLNTESIQKRIPDEVRKFIPYL